MAGTDTAQNGASKIDIRLPELGPLSWKTPADIEASLSSLYTFADKTGENTLDWYLRAKRPKQLWSRGLRLLAIFLAALGGLTPILMSLVGTAKGYEWLPQAGYLALGLAAGCVVLDKFFGFSSGWMRYITVAQELQAAASVFRFDWNMRWLALNGKELTPETASPLIEFVREYVAGVDQRVQKETQLWIAEFQSGLALVDQLAKSQAQGTQAVSDQPVAQTGTVVEPGKGSGNGTGKPEVLRPRAPAG